jgi:hypothetical protein
LEGLNLSEDGCGYVMNLLTANSTIIDLRLVSMTKPTTYDFDDNDIVFHWQPGAQSVGTGSLKGA